MPNIVFSFAVLCRHLITVDALLQARLKMTMQAALKFSTKSAVHVYMHLAALQGTALASYSVNSQKVHMRIAHTVTPTKALMQKSKF